MREWEHWLVKGYTSDNQGGQPVFEEKAKYLADVEKAWKKAIEAGATQVLLVAVFPKQHHEKKDD